MASRDSVGTAASIAESASLLLGVAPAPLEAERCVLGSAIVDPTVVDRLDWLSPAHFFLPLHAEAWEILCGMRREGTAIDAVTIFATFSSRTDGAVGEIVRQGQVTLELAKWVNSVPNSAHATYYAGIVAGHANARRLAEACREALRTLSENPGDVPQVADALKRAIAASLPRTQQVQPIGELAYEVVEQSMAAASASNEGTGPCMLTGLLPIDEFGGMYGGDLVILAARPGVGKSSLAAQIASAVAMRGRAALFASLEMTGTEIARRELSAATSLVGARIRAGTLSHGEFDRLAEAASGLRDVPLHVWAPPAATVDQVIGESKRLAQAGPLGLVVVDYVNLLSAGALGRGRRERQVHELIGEWTKALKAAAKELGVPFLVLAQLSRAAEDAPPTKAALKSSGSLEEDADMIWALHPAASPFVQFFVLKNRHGETGTSHLMFDGVRTRFSAPPADQEIGEF